MKKLMMTLAAGLFATAVVAEVTSANVVGYQTSNLASNQYTALGWQFSLVGGATEIPIASITNYPNVDTGGNFNSADGIRVFYGQNSTYTNYYRRSLTSWCKGAETVTTTDTIKPGQMVMFLKRTTGSTLTQAGEVINQDVNIVVASNQYTAVCNPFPMAIQIASITNYPNVDTGGNFNSADGIRVFYGQNSTYTNYYRRSLTSWCKGAETVTTTDTIPAGAGFMFLKRTAASTITFDTPLN
jgi:hypothetical protein